MDRLLSKYDMDKLQSGGIAAAEAIDQYFRVTDKITLHFKTWGNPAGIPVLFVHGGPGNCIAGYNNSVFFKTERYFVIEVDQRGCGLSTPSVQSDYRNMQSYLDISIHQMSQDFESLRIYLEIEKWLVFGGSWGSTLGIYYAENFPQRCLGLIVRGIFLNTPPEFNTVYARSSFKGDERRTKEFDIFFQLAVDEVNRRGESEPLDPEDSERFIRLYEAMIQRGDREAIWRFFVFENNLMCEEPSELFDPFVVDETIYPEATSVACFETRLFLRGTFEDRVDLLGDSAENLKSIPVWVVQGSGDAVTPDVYARQLVSRLQEVGCRNTAHFVHGGHLATSGAISAALQKSVDEFYAAISN